MDIEWGKVLAVAGNALIAAALYRVHCRIARRCKEVQDAPEYALKPGLLTTLQATEDGTLEYSCVSGLVQAQVKPLCSHYKDDVQGVIRKVKLVEHGSKRTQGFWTDSKRVVRDALNIAPFKIVGYCDSDPQVVVKKPREAMQLMQNLSSTYHSYEPNKTSAFERGMERIFGDVTKGFEETEKMLEVGTPILGIGKLSLDLASGGITISPPDGHQKYILTTLTKEEVIQEIEAHANFLAVISLLFGLVGTGLLAYWSYKYVRRWLERRRSQRILEEFRQLRQQQGNGDVDDSVSGVASCVICLCNPRDVITLDCAHVSMCADCAYQLPEPRICPVCRTHIERITPIYVP